MSARSVLVAALVALAAVPAALPRAEAQSSVQQDAGSIVGRSARAYRALGSLRADFEQVIDDKMIGRYESRGTLLQAGPAKLAMRFSDPAGEAIIIDGKSVWVYTPSTTPGQVLKMALPSGGPVYGFNILAWLLDRPAERYDTRWLRAERVNGRMADVVELLPRGDDFPFTRAVVWLDRDDALPRKLEIEERSGAVRTLTLSRLRANAPAPDSAFAFDVPPGVNVVEQ